MRAIAKAFAGAAFVSIWTSSSTVHRCENHAWIFKHNFSHPRKSLSGEIILMTSTSSSSEGVRVKAMAYNL
jgi:hypothetical protein